MNKTNPFGKLKVNAEQSRIIKNQLSPFILSFLILSFLTAYFILAWDDPSLDPPLGNVDAPINTGSNPQEKSGTLTVTSLTISKGILDFDDSSTGEIKKVDRIIGADKLSLLSNEDENGPIEIYGSKLNFYSSKVLKWQISSTGTLATGSVPWEKLIDFSDDCPENEYIVGIGINEDGTFNGTFKCGLIDCEILHKCAVSDGKGGCDPKGPGEYDNIPACQKCIAGELDPVYYNVNEQDIIDPNICDNSLGDSPEDTCYGCDGNGNCSFQTSDSYIKDQCPNSECFTGKCSGTGYSCGTYTEGKQNCELCMKCDPNGSGDCIPQTSDEDLKDDCPETPCENGFCSGIGSSCQAFKNYEESPECNDICYGCYDGVCTVINNQKDAYGDNQCADTHYGCENGVCANPQIITGCINQYIGCDGSYVTCDVFCSNNGYSCSGGPGKGYTESNCAAGSTWCGNPSSRSCICWYWKYN